MEEKINSIVIVGENLTIKNQKNDLGDIDNLRIETIENSSNALNFVDQNVILIINLDDKTDELQKLAELNHKKAAVIIIGNKQDANLLSIAITAGISAFLDTNHESHELVDSINNILYKLSSTKQKSTFNAFINAKGGAGASFIASNVAYILSQVKHTKVALVDMDLQFGSISLNFNINTPKYTITEALNEVNELDKVSISGYMEKYNDSLNLLLPSTHDIVVPGELDSQSLDKLISLLRENYNHLAIDLPRLIEPLSTLTMDQADNIVIVLQQNLAQFRDGRRLIHILNKDLEIDLNKIVIIINRYDKNNSLRKEDMVKLVNHDRVYTVANDFDLVETSSNLGMPLYEHSKNSKIATDLKVIAYALGNIQENKRKKFLGLF